MNRFSCSLWECKFKFLKGTGNTNEKETSYTSCFSHPQNACPFRWPYVFAEQRIDPKFIKDFWDEVWASLQTGFHKLLQFPFDQAYLQLLHLCTYPKIVHLARAVAPSAIEDPAQQFDSLIEDNLAQYFDLKLKTYQKIASIDQHAPTAPILVPAFYAASLRRLVDIEPHWHLLSSASLFSG